MLDQNTDRMYWVIGALIVGSVLILAAKTAFTSQFNQVTDKFQEVINGSKTIPADMLFFKSLLPL